MKHFFLRAILITAIGPGLLSCQPAKQPIPVKFGGEAQGTYYEITYFDAASRNFQVQIDSLLHRFDSSVSTYLPVSIISKVNAGDPAVRTDSIFNAVFRKSMEISENTNGAFDITVGPLVNAWGFGFSNRIKVDEHVIDSLLPLVNYKAVHLSGSTVYMDKPGIRLDYDAIAQGYSVDLIGCFLELKGIENYLVDVGGEVLAKGMKADGTEWSVGIEKPAANAEDGRSLKAIVKLRNKALSTSGNYRKYWEENGVRYAHTIDPKTGYPVTHSLLSASVLAPDCMTADGYATAFMVMGLERSKVFLSEHPGLQVYLIFSGPKGEMLSYISPGFKQIIVEQY